MSLRTAAACCLAASVLSPAVVAAEEAQGPWRAEAELGLVSTSGNTDTETFNAKAELGYESAPWKNRLRLEALHSSDGSDTTAERYLVSGRLENHFDPRHYAFGTARYEDDRFSGYDYQLSETVGVGRRVIETPALVMNLEAGAGARHSETDEGERQDEAIGRLAGDLTWNISPSAQFTEEVFTEAGAENTYSESISTLALKVNGNLAAKLSLTVKHNSDVPADTDNTDTITAVTLAYQFQ